MRITQFDHGLELNKATPGYIRTPGLHMSDIYNSLYKKLQPKRFDKGGGPNELAMEHGTAFEEVVEVQLSARLLGDRPGEFAATPEGIIVPVGTPNSIIFSPDQFMYREETHGGEFKSTKMSIRYGLQDPRFDKWFCQMKAYGKPLQMRLWELYALFINGDYSWKPPLGDYVLLAWLVEFTQRELDENWNMLMRHARREGMIK